MTKLAVSFIASALLLSAGTFHGVITDSMCGKDHSAMHMGPDSVCLKACARQGQKYALFDGKNAYKLSDQKTPAQFAAQKVKVTGTLNEKTGTIQVDKIEPLK